MIVRDEEVKLQGVVVHCDFHYEPADTGGDWDERLSAYVDIEAARVGGVDVLELMSEAAVDEIEARLLKQTESMEAAA